MAETSTNTLDNISQKTKLIFVDGIPEYRMNNGKKEDIVTSISLNNPGVIFFTDDTNLSNDEKNTEYPGSHFNIYKDGKKYTKFQDVIHKKYVSIGSHKIYLKNDDGFLYLIQGKEISDLYIESITQNKFNGSIYEDVTDINRIQDDNNNYIMINNNYAYNPESVEIYSRDNKFKIKYLVKLENDPYIGDDDGSGDSTLKFKFYRKDVTEYVEDTSFIEYLSYESSPADNEYVFRCIKPSNVFTEDDAKKIYIKAISNYDEEKYIYYPVITNINITSIVYREFDTGKIITKDIHMKLNQELGITFSYEPENANITATEISQNVYYYDLTENKDLNNTTAKPKFVIKAKQVTKNLPNGYTDLAITVGNIRNIFNVYITKDAEYYWYVGLEDPTNMFGDISEETIAKKNNEIGFHKINEKFVYTKESPLLDAEYNPIKFANEGFYYIAIPKNMPNNEELKPRHELYDAYLGDNENAFTIINDNLEIEEVTYIIYKSLVPAKQFAGKIF